MVRQEYYDVLCAIRESLYCQWNVAQLKRDSLFVSTRGCPSSLILGMTKKREFRDRKRIPKKISIASRRASPPSRSYISDQYKHIPTDYPSKTPLLLPAASVSLLDVVCSMVQERKKEWGYLWTTNERRKAKGKEARRTWV
ncbi:hypothetical protein K438DRAFT_1758951 [Mycena galopus ATCC 62051]|nr:hypothetical protein K438DRAFT_1758951 [Mycena galopus ATCC 62051]